MTDPDAPADAQPDPVAHARRVRALFAEAIKKPLAERAPWLEAACGDDEVLLEDVGAMLASHQESIIDPPGEDAESFDPERDEEQFIPVGTTIGHFRITDRLGEGGFGEVYLAEQEQPVRRRVALKVIKLGMDTRSVIARFESERQALAMMDSAEIARVFDAGVTPDGRPFFVMEYVEGEPITTYCDAHGLDLEQRLRLFIRLCDAIQHAHQKGVIHRDLKPSNILVSSTDRNDPAPKVIDFGIAKATTQKLTDLTLFTQQGQLIGTPEYMSPEQADARTDDIDTRSDVYALGVILYELLTGQVPFDRARIRGRGVTEIQRIIATESPPRPSTLLGSLPEEVLDRRSKDRDVRPAELRTTLRRELEWIPLKALRKDRSDRYGSAEALGDDVRRYLAGEPLQAVPESATYRLRKLIGRNRGRVIATTIITGLVLAGCITFALGEIRSRDARRDASILQSIRKLDADISNLINTQGSFQDKLDYMRAEFAADPLHDQLIELYTQRYDQLNLLHDVVHGIDHKALAAQYPASGSEEAEIKASQVAWADQVVNELIMEPAIERITNMAETSPDSAMKSALVFYRYALRFHLGEAMVEIGTLLVDCAERLQPENPVALASAYEALANGLIEAGRFDEAEGAYKRCEAILNRLDPELHPRALERSWYLMVNRAEMYERTGALEQALADFEQAVELGRKFPDRTDMADWSLMKLAMAQTSLGRYDEALETIDECSYSDRFLDEEPIMKSNDDWEYFYALSILEAIEASGDLERAATIARKLCRSRDHDMVAAYMTELDEICGRAERLRRQLDAR